MKNIIIGLCLMLVTGCGVMNKSLDWVNEDELKVTLTGVTVRQLTMRYIEQGDRKERAAKVTQVANDLDKRLDQTTTMTINELMMVINKNVEMKKLNPSDMDLITSIVQLGMGQMEADSTGQLTEQSKITARELISQLKLAASFY